MKVKLLLALGISLFLTNVVSSQELKVDKLNPFSGELRGSYFAEQSNGRTIEINLQLNSTTDESGLVANNDIRNCNIKVTKINITSGSFTEINTKPNLSVITVDTNKNSHSLNFALPISNNNSTPNNGISYLPKNWTDFDYQISCEIKGGDPVTRKGSYEKPAKAVRASFPIQFKKPIVHQNSPEKVLIPMLSSKTVKVGVKMLLGGNESATGDGVLTGGKWGTIELRANNPIAVNNPYKIELSFPDFEDDLFSPSINNTDATICTSVSGNNCVWGSRWTNPYSLVNATITQLSNVKVSSATEEKTISVSTTADIKTLKMKLGNNFVSQECKYENESRRDCEFKLTKAEIREGENAISFEGESQDGVPFTTPSNLKITKTAQPTVEGVPVFKVVNNNFTMTYKFKGDVSRVTASIIYEDPTKQNQNAWTQSTNCGQADGNGIKTCEFNLGVSGIVLNNLSEEEKKKPDIPVRLQIDARDGNGTTFENLDSISFRLVNQEQVKNKLTEIEKDWKTNENTTKTLELISELLFGNKTQTTDVSVTQTFDAIKAGPNRDRYKFLFGIAKGLANFGLNYFGIPIRF